jgi:preprotein translocase subunit SecD
MKIIKSTTLIGIFFILIWINLPENFFIKPLTIDWNILGMSIKKEFRTHYGLDLKGGSHLVYQADLAKIKKEDIDDALEGVKNIIEKRVNFFGVSEPTVQLLKSGENYRIVVDLPGTERVDEAISIIGQTAQLSFVELEKEKLATTAADLSLFSKMTDLTGKDVKKASVVFNPQTGKPEVGLSFTENGKKLFGELTERNIGKQVPIFLDNQLLSAPVVQQAIKDGNAVITGNFSVDEAKQLAMAINSGALPVPIKLVEQKNIGPTLGQDEVKKSFIAGIIGLTAVSLFMIGYYGKMGMIATLALFIYGLISLAIFRLIPVVLTLPGIAGFILSIGMAVDSNILIFERIKEELRKGKSFDIAFRLGFGRAINAIKDANFTTLTLAFILFNPLNWGFLPQFGMVRGFALTLAIGVITSLFTGVVITKRLIKVFYKIN